MMGGRNARGYHRAPPQVLDLLLVALTLSHLPACSSRPSEALVTHEALIDAIDRSPLSDVSVHVGDAEVELFAYSKGQEAPARNETIFIASASKWVTGVVIMHVVEDGFMRLEDRPQDFLSFWSTEGRKSRVTLHSLLSFTSGFQGSFADSPCLTSLEVSILKCTQQIHDRLDDLPFEPGTTFSYSNENLEIAAAMAEAATGLPWDSLYEMYLRQPLNISSSSSYSGGKGVAGNLQISAADYITIMTSELLRKNSIASTGGDDYAPLTLESLDKMNTDHTAEPKVRINENKTFAVLFNYSAWPDWHYGYGHWIECPRSTAEWSPDCTENTVRRGVHSSIGAAGFYPIVDYRLRKGKGSGGMTSDSGLYIVISPSPTLFLASLQNNSPPGDTPFVQSMLLGSELLELLDAHPAVPESESAASDNSSPETKRLWSTLILLLACTLSASLL